jgi:ethanolamine utilization protein EutN
MILGKVIGNFVSTIKHQDYQNHKLLVIQPVDPTGAPKGKSLLAVDAVQSGIGDMVLVIDEGGAGRAVLEAPDKKTVRTVVVGIVDEVTADSNRLRSHHERTHNTGRKLRE